jgi:hypothetical protein
MSFTDVVRYHIHIWLLFCLFYRQAALLCMTLKLFNQITLSSSYVQLVSQSFNFSDQSIFSFNFNDYTIFSELRKDNISDLDRVLELCRSHINLTAKNILLIKVMDEVRTLHLVFIFVYFSFFSLLFLSVVILQLLLPNSYPMYPPPVVYQITLLSTDDTARRPVLPQGIPIKHDINIRNLKIRLTALARLRQPMYSHISFRASLVLMNQYTLKPEQVTPKFLSLDDICMI